MRRKNNTKKIKEITNQENNKIINDKNFENSIKKLTNKEKNLWKKNQVNFFKTSVRRNFTNDEKLYLLSEFKNDFIAFFNSEIEKDFYRFNQGNLNALNKSLKNISNFTKIYSEIITNKITINVYFKEANKPILKRSTFFNIKNKFIAYCYSGAFNFNKLIVKSTKPVNPKTKYNHLIELHIANLYYECYKYEYKIYPSIQQIYCILKTRNFTWQQLKIFRDANFEKLSINTVKRIIRSDDRWSSNNTIAEIKHPIRTHYIPVGYWQFDLKIIGALDSPIKKPIIMANIKDEGSKVVFSKILIKGSIENILKFLDEFKGFADFQNLEIKRIRTDNAMMFKDNNFVKSETYANWLKKQGIKLQHSYLGQPQCNGSVERFHLTIDLEFLPMIKQCKSLDEIIEQHQVYIEYYNHERFIHNTVNRYDKFIERYVTPISMARELNELFGKSLYKQNKQIINLNISKEKNKK